MDISTPDELKIYAKQRNLDDFRLWFRANYTEDGCEKHFDAYIGEYPEWLNYSDDITSALEEKGWKAVFDFRTSWVSELSLFKKSKPVKFSKCYLAITPANKTEV